MERLFLVQIKSGSLIKEGKKALLIPMSIDNEELKNNNIRDIHEAFIRDARKLYPQYTKLEDSPVFSISKITKKEYKEWKKTNILRQKSMMKGVA